MEETIERLYYKFGYEANEKIARHIMRYNFAGSHALKYKPLKILDFGCGSGYGTKLLSSIENVEQVVGYDVSEDAIKYAEENNSDKGTVFLTNFEEMLKKGPYDIVILMDMIEHLEEKVAEETLKNLKENSPNATFFISTPLWMYNGPSKSGNKYHINMYTRERFEGLLKTHFKNVELSFVDWLYSRLAAKEENTGPVISECWN